MNKADLLGHIADYQKNKSWFRKILPGFQNWWPKVSFAMSRLIRFTNRILPEQGYSASEFNQFEIKNRYLAELEKIVKVRTFGLTAAIFQTIRITLQREKDEAIAAAQRFQDEKAKQESEERQAQFLALTQKVVADSRARGGSQPTVPTRSATSTSPYSAQSSNSSRSVTPVPHPVVKEEKLEQKEVRAAAPASQSLLPSSTTSVPVPSSKKRPTRATDISLLHYASDGAAEGRKKRRRKHTGTLSTPTSAYLPGQTTLTPPTPLRPTLQPRVNMPAVSDLKLDAAPASPAHAVSPTSSASSSSETDSPPEPAISLVAATTTREEKSVHTQRYNDQLRARAQKDNSILRAGFFGVGMGAIEFANAYTEGETLAIVPRAVLSTLVYGAIAYGAESNSILMTMASTLLTLARYGFGYRTMGQAAMTAAVGVAVNHFYQP